MDQERMQLVGDNLELYAMPPQEREKRKRELNLLETLERLRITTETQLPPQQFLFRMLDKPCFPRGELVTVTGKAKSGKTFFLSLLMGMGCLQHAASRKSPALGIERIPDAPLKVLWFDTEQSRTDTKLILQDVAQMTELPPETIDAQVSLHSLRRIDQEQLLPLLERALEDEKPQVVMLDGIVEFVASFNDETESKHLIKELLKLSDQHNCAIVCVLHTNKADEDHNMRGHLGTMLAQKSATVLECVKERGSSVITVRCSEARHEEMPEWSITFDQDGHIVDADEQRRQLIEQRKAEQQQRRLDAAAEKQKERLDYALMCIRDNGGSISRKQLMAILVKKFELERSTVSKFISSQVETGALLEADKNISASPDVAMPF